MILIFKIRDVIAIFKITENVIVFIRSLQKRLVKFTQQNKDPFNGKRVGRDKDKLCHQTFGLMKARERERERERDLFFLN